MPLCTPSGEVIATDCTRVVNGERGEYWEFEKDQLIAENLHMPQNAKWRIKHKKCYYLEYRTNADNVKIYYQRKRVNYADYIPGRFYIAYNDLHYVEPENRERTTTYRFRCHSSVCWGIKKFRSDEREPEECPICGFKDFEFIGEATDGLERAEVVKVLEDW